MSRIKIRFNIINGPTVKKVYDHKLTLHEAIYLLTDDDKKLFPECDVYFYYEGEEIDLKRNLVNGMCIVVSTNSPKEEERIIKYINMYPGSPMGLGCVCNFELISGKKNAYEMDDDLQPDDGLGYMTKLAGNFIRRRRLRPIM